MTNKYNISEKLFALETFSKKTRQDLHKIPELSGQEFKTSQYCRELMESFGYNIRLFEGYTGFTADLIVDPTKRLIAYRTDIDGLEMPDLTCNEHSSVHEGCAHNCGHDTHMTIALTAAKYLSENRSELTHNVRFIFQMAEEDMRIPGANKMVEMGCMEGVDEVYGLHNDAAFETGYIKFNSGVMSSYGSAWTLDVHGVSAHGSTPHKGLDAIREATRIIDYMDYIVAKKTDPFSPAVFGCGMINGGTIPNALADHVQARGTIRSMDEETDKILKASFNEIVARSEAGGFKTTLEASGYPAVVNHPQAAKVIYDAAAAFLPIEHIDSNGKPMTGSEDFSYMINATKGKLGAMYFLGSGNQAKGINNYLHANPYFVDDDCLLIGAQIFINIATR
ncbi:MULTISPECIES: M20 metallopeptidase family protein [Providencia]|uniref:Amidohydrolase n=1 Tax=Providencia huaxiensis TaxID=2027290 RepID=A0A8I2DAT4_9GAMM|nr:MULTISPECIES: M20 family metallopeptidase [Providencia]MBN6360015.1 amidohydrolase [Providencia huaxiensis]MBQ0269001.1 amidohydrolase [Providencia huaxiensis]QPE16571.1 amidohydrolase [Providencia rettgeri]